MATTRKRAVRKPRAKVKAARKKVTRQTLAAITRQVKACLPSPSAYPTTRDQPGTIRVPLIRVNRHQTLVPAEVRALIPTLPLVNLLISNVRSDQLALGQVRSIDILLRKVLPDIQAIAIMGEAPDTNITIRFPDLGVK